MYRSRSNFDNMSHVVYIKVKVGRWISDLRRTYSDGGKSCSKSLDSMQQITHPPLLPPLLTILGSYPTLKLHRFHCYFILIEFRDLLILFAHHAASPPVESHRLFCQHVFLSRGWRCPFSALRNGLFMTNSLPTLKNTENVGLVAAIGGPSY